MEVDDALSKAKALELHAARSKAGAIPVSEVGSQGAAAALSKLQPISIAELKPGKIHSGFALFGTLCAEPFRSQAVHTVLEDSTGRAILVCLYNAAVSSTSNSALKQRFPSGAKVVIKEPFLKTEKGGVLVVRVDNLLNFERVVAMPESRDELSSARVEAEVLKAEGSRLFSTKEWLAAAEAYTRCIALASSPAGCNKDLLAAALSNRAEAWIRLGNFEQALSDSNQAIKLDATLFKAMVRKARALHGLHEYELALACMEKVAEAHRSSAGNVLQQLEAGVRLSKTGSFDIAGFLKSGRAREKAPFCVDFIGPVSIQKSSISGRGLFAKRDLKAGELLLVSNAVAVAYGDSASASQWQALQDDLVTSVMAALVSSRKGLQQVNALLAANKTPSLDLFRPNSSCYQDSFEMDNAKEVRFDPESIRKLVKDRCLGQFVWHKLEGMVNSADSVMNSRSCGLWLLPSLINHSCVPNSARLEVGKAMFVHAARDIAGGEEITLPYFDALVPLHIRQEICQARWGFQCQCERCLYERGVQSVALKKVVDQFRPLHDKAFREINSAAESGVEFPAPLPACASFAQLSVKIESEVGGVNRSFFFPSSFALAYLAGFPATEFFEESQTQIPPGDTLAQAFHAVVPGHWRTLVFRASELIRLRQYFDKEKWNEGVLLAFRQEVYNLCRSTLGNQSVEVYDELIPQLAMLRPW